MLFVFVVVITSCGEKEQPEVKQMNQANVEAMNGSVHNVMVEEKWMQAIIVI